MSVIIKTGFQSITHDILFQPQTMMKGKQLVSAQHIRDVEELRENGQSYAIQARVIRQTSISSTPYKTSLNINSERVVTDVKCDCVYNQSAKCKHIAALIDFINNKESTSKTSEEQQWGKPSARQFAKDKYSKGKYFDEMFPTTKRKSCDQQPFNLSELVDDSPLKLVMTAATQVEDTFVVNDVMKMLLDQVETHLEKGDCVACLNNFSIFLEEFEVHCSENKIEKHLSEFYKNNIVMKDEDIINLCCETIQQSLSKDWHAARRLRISASTNVHNIKVRTRKTIESLVSSMLNPQKLDTEATRYGLSNELKALEKYEKLNNCQVKRVGVIISKHQPWLCASIDGVVVENGCITKLVEVKCPILCKKQPVIDFNNKSCRVSYLEFVNDVVELKNSKPYYTQVQVQMYITGTTMCDLFVYSPIESGSCIVRVDRDDNFIKSVVLSAEKFYMQDYLPALYTAKSGLTPEKRCFTGKDSANLK